MDFASYYMNIAIAVRERANCKGRRVGAVIVKDNRIVSTGYNGTPESLLNCLEGGCKRCSDPDRFPSGTGYDMCICVHAEQNAILSSARFGIPLEGAEVYTTLKPCFNCLKALLQVKVEKLFYLHKWEPREEQLGEQYRLLLQQFPGGVHQVAIQDPRLEWAMNLK